MFRVPYHRSAVGSRDASEPLHEVEVRPNLRIPARDGIELSATLVLPRGSRGSGPWPAVLNMDPYRKDDWSSAWSLSLGTYLAERGFAYCRLDVRGTGSSSGVALDEYAQAETLDGYDSVEWLAAQPWCNGAVGMWGISYGGFTSLQVAALQPPHLRAIVPIQATDDRYTDDVHYVGGAMTVSELSQYAVSQVAMNALPPLPEAWGDNWREQWLERLKATPIWLLEWARRQRDGAYWRQGSIAPGYERIRAAILHFGGWMDEYVDAALRMQARCSGAPRRTIVGPWVHGLPDHAYPSPHIDWLHELVRWFDHWLKGIDNGVEAEPALTWFQREFTPPERFPEQLRGSWRAVGAWPAAAAAWRSLALDAGEDVGRGRLAPTTPAAAGADQLDHRPTAGIRGGSLCWGAGSPPNGLAGDLRLEEPDSIVYTSDPLTTALEILGAPVAVIHVASSRPVATLVARIGDVAPDGAVEQVCEGLLNLTHRESHADPTELEPGRVYEIRLALRSAGFRFAAGHRIRLSLATSHWPVVWPAPGDLTLTIQRGPGHPSRLELPLAPSAEAEVPPPEFKEEAPVLGSFGSDDAAPPTWEVVEDHLAGTVSVRTYEASTGRLPDGLSTLFLSEALLMTASDFQPGSGRFENTCEYRLRRDGLDVLVVADGTTVAGPVAFDMTGSLRVEVDGEPFFERRWDERITRDLL